MHGGLFSKDDVKIDDIKAISRNRQPPDSGKFLIRSFFLTDKINKSFVILTVKFLL